MGGMLRIIGWILTPVLALLAVAIAQSLLHTWWLEQATARVPQSPVWVWLACPIAFSIRAIWAWACNRMGWDNPWSFIDTLEHELTHALFGYLTGNPPVSLRASLQGDGEVQLKGQNVLTLLSPYFFPLFLSVAVALSLGMAKGYRLGFTVLCMALMGSFLFRLLAEFRWRQSDLHAYGFLFSTAFSAALLIGVLGSHLSLLGLLPWNWVGDIPNKAWSGAVSIREQAMHWYAWFMQIWTAPN
jgi:Peptidase M50B-like